MEKLWVEKIPYYPCDLRLSGFKSTCKDWMSPWCAFPRARRDEKAAKTPARVNAAHG